MKQNFNFSKLLSETEQLQILGGEHVESNIKIYLSHCAFWGDCKSYCGPDSPTHP